MIRSFSVNMISSRKNRQRNRKKNSIDRKNRRYSGSSRLPIHQMVKVKVLMVIRCRSLAEQKRT